MTGAALSAGEAAALLFGCFFTLLMLRVPVAVALGHGLHASRLDGRPMRYNGADTLMPDLLICRPEWAAPVLALLEDMRQAG